MRLTTGSRSKGARSFTTGFPPASISATGAVVGALLLVFALDRATNSVPVQHLYYLPIIIAAITFGIRGGVSASLAAVILYHLGNPQLLTFKYEQWDIVQISLFIAVGVITARLTHDARRLHQLAMTDDLTGLHNLRSFEGRLTAMVRASREAGTPLALLVLDVDRLKILNDEYGHLAGAEAVRTVGDIIGSRVPAEAVACRYGGDEFVIAIAGCTPSQARDIADDLRRAVNAAAPCLAGIQFAEGTLSISIGGACRACAEGAATHDEEGEALFRTADTALYRAKERGRNQVFVAGADAAT